MPLASFIDEAEPSIEFLDERKTVVEGFDPAVPLRVDSMSFLIYVEESTTILRNRVVLVILPECSVASRPQLFSIPVDAQWAS